jgi:hypothetical protein
MGEKALGQATCYTIGGIEQYDAYPNAAIWIKYVAQTKNYNLYLGENRPDSVRPISFKELRFKDIGEVEAVAEFIDALGFGAMLDGTDSMKVALEKDGRVPDNFWFSKTSTIEGEDQYDGKIQISRQELFLIRERLRLAIEFDTSVHKPDFAQI